MKKVVFFLLLGSLSVLSAISPSSEVRIFQSLALVSLSSHQVEPISIQRVIDGDTVVLQGGEHLRLIGIDTPERGETFYKEAKLYLIQLLKGEKIWLEYDRRRKDRYGRLLGYLFVRQKANGTALFVNGQMVLKGYASVYPYPPNLRYWKALTKLQKRAREKMRGIWRQPQKKPESHYIGSRYRFHRPSCRGAQRLRRRRKVYTSREAALDAGLSPARCCHP